MSVCIFTSTCQLLLPFADSSSQTSKCPLLDRNYPAVAQTLYENRRERMGLLVIVEPTFEFARAYVIISSITSDVEKCRMKRLHASSGDLLCSANMLGGSLFVN